jgi:hypothetical protein
MNFMAPNMMLPSKREKRINFSRRVPISRAVKNNLLSGKPLKFWQQIYEKCSILEMYLKKSSIFSTSEPRLSTLDFWVSTLDNSETFTCFQANGSIRGFGNRLTTEICFGRDNCELLRLHRDWRICAKVRDVKLRYCVTNLRSRTRRTIFTYNSDIINW